MKKINNLFKLVPALAIVGTSIPLISLTGCNKGSNDNNETYSVTYNTPTGLTWTTTANNVKKNSALYMEYTLESGYAINISACSITVGGTSITNQITWKSGKISIPGSLITGDVVIYLQLKTAASYTVSHVDTSADGLHWTSIPTTCTSGTNYEASYTLDSDKTIDTENSTIFSGTNEITNYCTFGNGTLIIDGNYITGNVVITIVTKVEEDTPKDERYINLTGGTITTKAGTASTVYTFATSSSTNDSVMSVTLQGTWLNTSIKIASAGTYNITLADGFKLSNTDSTDITAEPPITITKKATGAIVNFIIPDDVEATINDKRTSSQSVEYYDDPYVIRHNDSTAAGQLNFIGGTSGGGVLNINNLNNNKGCFEKAIQSKVNMTISGGVTINAFSYDTCIQCGGKLIIDNANVLADSYYDDGIKTKLLDPAEDLSLVSTNGNANRDILIKGGSIVTVYSDMTGINAAHNFATESTSTGTPTINVYTNTQAKSAKSGSVAGVTTSTEQNMFVEVPSSLSQYCGEDYFWTIDFYDASKTATTTEYMTLKKIATTSGGQGGSGSTNYFLKCDRPLSTDASYFKINLYAKAQYGAATMTATASSDYKQPYTTATSTSTKDCLAVSSISGTTISTSSTKFDRNYKATEKGESQEEIDTIVSAKGIKAKNNIALSSGTINVKSLDTSISCSYGDIYCNSATAGDITLGQGTIQVSGATISAYSPNNSGDGIKAYGQLDISAGSIDISNAVEAIEAPVINISGGKTVIYATDDGLNASTAGKYQTSGLSFNMSGGILDVQTKSGDTDCIDSNNTITITGGLLVSRVPGSGSAMTLDWESGDVDVTGTATIVLLGKTEADGMNEANPQPSSLSINNKGTDYTSQSTASTICATGNHTVTYYSTKTTSSGTDSYTYNNKSTMSSTKVRIWSCTGTTKVQ